MVHVAISLASVVIPLCPPCIIAAVAAVLVGGLPVAPRAAPERPGVVIIPIPRSDVRLPPVVIAIGRARGPRAASRSLDLVAFVAASYLASVARIVEIPRIEIQHRELLFDFCKMGSCASDQRPLGPGR
jgi:hypothetical protein